MAADTSYLRKMLKERGRATVYGDGVQKNEKLKAEGRVLIVGDVQEGAQIASDKSIIVIGNVKSGARIYTSGSILVTGKSAGSLYKLDDDLEDFAFSLTIGKSNDDDTAQDKVTVLGLDDATGELAVHEAMEWLGTHRPFIAPRSLSRKFGVAAGVAAGATLGALGIAGLSSLGLDATGDFNTIAHAAATSPWWTLFGGYVGLCVSNSRRPKMAPLALRDQHVPLPALPPPAMKMLPAPEEAPKPKKPRPLM